MRLLMLFVLAAFPVAAQDTTDEDPLEAPLPPVEERIGYSYYIVQGPTLDVVSEVMVAKGPANGAALWQVTATPDCAVSLNATYTLPKLIGKRDFEDLDIAAWEGMLDALELYQGRHISIAQEAASAVREARCTTEDGGGVDAILAPFLERANALDAETENGRTDGVTLELPEQG
ncbi:MAG: DUF922 domain-containing protein [Pseudomonadota bacterium]